MKYINGRDSFLEKYNSINEKFDMSGEGGPFHNEINWGDSLVGRLINSFRRKVGIGTNIVRIKLAVERLKEEFKRIICYSEAADLPEDIKKKIGSLIIYELIRTIHFAISQQTNIGYAGSEDVDSGDKQSTKIEDKVFLKEVQSIIESVIDSIKHPLKGYEPDNSEEIIVILNELLEEVKKMQKLLKGESNEEDGEEEEDVKKTFEVGKYYLYKGKKDNIIIFIKKIADGSITVANWRGNNWGEVTSGFKVDNIIKTINVSDKILNVEDLKGTNFEGQNIPICEEKKEDKKTFEVGKYYLYKGKSEEIIVFIKKIESGSIEAGIWNKNKKYWAVTTSDFKVDNIIKNINASDKILDTQNLENFKGQNIPVFGKKMGDVSSAKPSGDIKSSTDVKLGADGKPIETSEKIIRKYSDFMKMNEDIEETTQSQIESTDQENNSEETETNSEISSDSEITLENQKDILNKYWINLFNKKLIKLIITDKIATETKNEVEKTKGNSKDSIIISGIDPVIEILKCFNRAYKLHTTQVIPSGRTGGQVSNRTFREYTALGSGDPDSAGKSGGPYRNNKVFDIWENAVLDILKDRKYQPIFNKGTKLQVGDKMKEGAGTILLKLMRDLLDGDALYKKSGGSGEGAQNQFLKKYFGDVIDKDSIDPGDLAIGGETEMNNNAKLANEIKIIELKFTDKDLGSGNDDIKNINDLKGSFFRIENAANGKTNDYLYFYIQDVDKKDIYIILSNKFGVFKTYLENNAVANSETCSMGTLRSASNSEIFLTKINWDIAKEHIIKKNGNITLKAIDIKGANSDIKINTNKSSWLRKIEDGGKESVFKITKFNFGKPVKTQGFLSNELKSKAPETKK